MKIIDRYLEAIGFSKPKFNPSVYSHDYKVDPNKFLGPELSKEDGNPEDAEGSEEYYQKYDPRNVQHRDNLKEDDRELDTLSAKEKPPEGAEDSMSKPGTYQFPKGFVANPERQECILRCTKIKDEKERKKCLKKCG